MNKTDVRNDEVATANTGDPAVAAQAAMGGALPQTSAERELLAPKKHAVRHKKEDEDEQAASAARSDDAGLVADADIDNPDASPFAAATAGDEPLIFADAAAAGGTATDAAAGGSAAGGAAAGGAAAGGAAAAGGVGVGAYIGGGLLLAAAAGGGGGGGGGGGDGDTTAPVAPTVTLTSDTGASATDLITNNGALTLGGVEAGATVEYSTDGTTWTTTFTAAAGENTVYVRQTDAAGNVGAASAAFTFTLDTTASTISVVAPDNTNDSTPTISGTTNAAEGSTVTITVSQSGSADQTLTATVQADGSYSANVTTALADGAYTAAASVTDTAGNTGTANDSGSVDTSAPSVTVNAPDLTNDSTPVISGTTDAPVGNTVTITISQGATEVDSFTTTVQSGGTFSASPSALPDGDYTVEASVAGSTGTVGTGTDSNFTVDATVVAPTINTVAGNNVVIDAEATAGFNITGTGEVGATVTLSFTSGRTLAGGNTAVVDGSGNWTVAVVDADVTAFSEGAETITASQTDLAGNTSGNATRAITVDTSVPATPTITATVAGNNIVNDAEATAGFNITGTGEVGATVTLSFTSGHTLAGGNTAVVDGSGNWTVAVADADVTAFGEGAETITASQTDLAGNTSGNATRAITVDTVAAAPTIDAVATNNIVNDAEATAGFNITGTGEVGATVTLSFTSGHTLAGGNTAVVDGSGNWTVAVADADVTAFSEGAETITASQSDAAGNTSGNATQAITVDTVLPTATVVTPGTYSPNDNIPVQSSETGIAYLVSDSVTVNSVSDIWNAGTNQVAEVTISTANATTNLPANDDVALLNGSYHVYTYDAAGNLSDPSTGAVTIAADETDPVFSGGITAAISVVENFPVQTSTTYGTLDVRIYDPDADNNVGVTYTLSGADAALFRITDPTTDIGGMYTTVGGTLYPAGIGVVTALDFENATDVGGDNVYNFTVTATDTSGNFASQNVTLTVTDDGFAPADEVIELGADGQLISAFSVGVHDYYFWDINSDGDFSGADSPTHNTLNGIFTLGSDYTTANPDIPAGTTDTYRYALLGDSSDQQVILPSRDELQAIWAALGADMPGIPAYDYWSATPGTAGSYYIANLGDTYGDGADYAVTGNDNWNFIIVEYAGPVV